PGTRRGRRLLAHEIVHTAQQGAVPRRHGAGSTLSRGAHGPQLTPGVDADDSWLQIIAATSVTPNESGRQARSAEAIRRLLALPEGVRLVNSLWRDGRPTPTAAPRYGVNVAFVDNIPAAVGGGFETGIDGRFEPRDNPTARRYNVFIKNVEPPLAGT